MCARQARLDIAGAVLRSGARDVRYQVLGGGLAERTFHDDGGYYGGHGKDK
jgi:hypothetical protein